jgi:hypothetical protein
MKKRLISRRSVKKGTSSRFAAESLGLSRFDYVCRQEIKDLEIKKRILELRKFHKNDGYRRLE